MCYLCVQTKPLKFPTKVYLTMHKRLYKCLYSRPATKAKPNLVCSDSTYTSRIFNTANDNAPAQKTLVWQYRTNVFNHDYI